MPNTLMWGSILGIPLLLLLGKKAGATVAPGEMVPAIEGNVNGKPVIRPAAMQAPPVITTTSPLPSNTPVTVYSPDGEPVPPGQVPPDGSFIMAIDAIQAGYMNTVLQPGVAPENVVLYLQPEDGTSVPADQVGKVLATLEQIPRVDSGFATSTPTGYTTPLPEAWIWATDTGTPINITVAPPELVAATLNPPAAPVIDTSQSHIVLIDSVPYAVYKTKPTTEGTFGLISRGGQAVWVHL